MLQTPLIPPLDNATTKICNSSTDATSSREGDGEDICVTIETDNSGSDFSTIKLPRALVRKESMQRDHEKQISVDPISLKGSIRQDSIRLVASPTPRKTAGTNLPPSVMLAKLKFLSSASSLPKNKSSLLNKIWRNQNDVSPRPAIGSLSRQYSAMDDAHLGSQESSTRRSKSMDEGRMSIRADDFDRCLKKPSFLVREESNSFSNKQPTRSFSKQESSGNRSKKGKSREINPKDGFKCGRLCLFLPRGRGKGKGKPVRSSSRRSCSSKTKASVISRTVSLEKFECGAWTSSTLMNDKEDGESANLFFDLPLELIRCSISEMQSPITAAFVFNEEGKMEKELKGVLKNGGLLKENGGRKSSRDSTGRHVRFSISSQPPSQPSSPMSISPRLRKAREDFNAFLKAQNA